MAAIGWLNIIICINFAGHGRADTVWVAQLEHEHHLGKGASIGSGAATESIDVCGCATLPSAKAKLEPLGSIHILSRTRV